MTEFELDLTPVEGGGRLHAAGRRRRGRRPVTPERAFARRLAAEIEHELERLEQLGEEVAAVPLDDDNAFALRARGSMLHDFYGGIERVFVRIAEELDGGVPHGEQWHRQIAHEHEPGDPGRAPRGNRARVSLRELGDYLRFRHVFRNVVRLAAGGRSACVHSRRNCRVSLTAFR